LIGGVLKSISVLELKELFDKKTNFTLLDVRESEELSIAKIEQNTHIPMGEIVERIKEINIDVPVVVMCHSGVRSARVCGYLNDNGYDAINLTGGISSWSREIDPSIPQY
tara:strand:+ start:434 stop:763 length:330 start_codon:yes stop_codon:yes gene_type:complete